MAAISLSLKLEIVDRFPRLPAALLASEPGAGQWARNSQPKWGLNQGGLF